MINFIKEFTKGGYFLVKGYRCCFEKGIKRYLFVPFIINLVTFISVSALSTFYLWKQLHHFADGYINQTGWIIIAWVLTTIVFPILLYLLSTTAFVIATHLIGAPFYGLLAEKVFFSLQKQISTTVISKSINPYKELIKILPRTLLRESLKMGYMVILLLLFAVVIVVLSFLLPFLPFLWFILMAWFIALQYIDYTPDFQGVSFQQARIQIRSKWWRAMGFGSAVSLLLLVPGLNLFVPPAAVAGGVLFWVSLQDS